MLAQLQAGVPVWTGVGWFITNTAEALMGAFCITRFADGRKVLETVRGVLAFVVFGVLLAPFATSFLDAAAVVLTGWGRGYWPLGAERFWTNAFAELTLVPIIVVCASMSVPLIRETKRARFCEGGLLAIGTLLLAGFVFGFLPMSPAAMPGLLYIPLPLLVWATVRFGSGGLSLSTLCVAQVSIWYTMHGHEPFPYASLRQNILSIQILLCIDVVPLMFLAAVMSEARRTQESLRSISGSLIEAQEQERHRIARELHDDLGQQLVMAHMSLKTLIEKCDVSVKASSTELSDQLSAISTSVHDLSHGLYPSQLELVGLARALRRLCEEMGRQNCASINFKVGNAPSRLQPTVSLCLYRIAQEALHNVAAHSQARTVEVELHADDRQIVLRIIDDGIGFDLKRETAGLGLPSMRERVRSVGGSIDMISSPKTGTRIEARVPLEEDNSDVFGAA